MNIPTRTFELDVDTAVEQLPKLVQAGQFVLTLYMPIEPLDPESNIRLTMLRDAARDLRDSLAGDELTRFDGAVARCESFLRGTSIHYPGIALFDYGTEDLYAVGLPSAIGPRLYWIEEPVTLHLRALLDEYERSAVVLIDKERARLLMIRLGKIEESIDFTDEVPGKQATGDWFALSQTRYERHHQVHVVRHVQRLIDTVARKKEESPFNRLLVGGPPEALALLREKLPQSLANLTVGTLALPLFTPDAEIPEAVKWALEAAERQEELDLVHSIKESCVTNRGVLGVEPTLGALHEGRVHELVMVESMDLDLWKCASCSRLTTSKTACQTCGSLVTPIRDPLVRIAQLAEKQGAAIEFVAGLAGAELLAEGGLAARTRY